MLRRLWAVGLLAVAALTAAPVVVIQRTGTPTGSFGGPNNIVSLYASFTTTTAVSGNFTLTGTFSSSNGLPATATAYLTTAVGSSTTPAQVALTVPITVSSTTPTVVTLAANPGTIPAGTYYLVIGNMSANFQWDTANPAGETVGAGVTSNPDANDTVTPPANPPYTSNGFVPNSPARSLILSLTYTPVSVPTVSNGALGGTALLLLGAGLWLMRRRRPDSVQNA